MKNKNTSIQNRFISSLDLETKIREIRAELENRYKTGQVKMIQAADGTLSFAKIEDLQNELFELIYKLSLRK